MYVPTVVTAYEYIADQFARGFAEATVYVTDGPKIDACMANDDDSSPADNDCYSEQDKQGFRDGSWRFIGVKLTVTILGIESSADLWSIEFGLTTDKRDRDYLVTSILPDLYAEAVDDIRTAIKLVDAAFSATD